MFADFCKFETKVCHIMLFVCVCQICSSAPFICAHAAVPNIMLLRLKEKAVAKRVPCSWDRCLQEYETRWLVIYAVKCSLNMIFSH